MRAKVSLVGRGKRSQAGSRGRVNCGSGGFETGILLFKLHPEPRQLIGAEVPKNLTVYVNHRGELLSGKLNHFVISGFIRNDINGLIINAPFVEPTLGFMAPAAIRFDEQANPLRFHALIVADFMPFFKSVV